MSFGKEIRISTRFRYSPNPIYMVLVYPGRKGKGWIPLKLHTGKPAYFSQPPTNYEEAMRLIDEHKRKALK